MRSALALFCLLFMSACDDALATPSEDDVLYADSVGSLSIPLSASGADGDYQLRKATFEVSGSALITLSARERDEQLTSHLPVGDYTVFLRPGYELLAIDADGRATPVEATLDTAMPMRLHVGPLNVQHIHLHFHAGDRTVVLGDPPQQVSQALVLRGAAD